jgi:hypothetical protein
LTVGPGSASVASGSPLTAPVTLTATTLGAGYGTITYAFRKSTGYLSIPNYQVSNVFNWAAPPGIYYLSVYAEDSASGGMMAKSQQIPYTVYSPSLTTTTGVALAIGPSPSPSPYHNPTTPITLTGSVTSGTGAGVQYQYKVYDIIGITTTYYPSQTGYYGSTAYPTQPASFALPPSNYTITAYAYDPLSTVVASTTPVNYQIMSAALTSTSLTLTPSLASPQGKKTAIRLTIGGLQGTGLNVNYAITATDNTTGVKTNVLNTGHAFTATWTPTVADTYTLYATATDPTTGVVASCTSTYVIQN